MDVKSHIFLGSNGKAEKYTAPSRGGGSKKLIPDQIVNSTVHNLNYS